MKEAGDDRIAHYGHLALMTAFAFALLGMIVANKIGVPVLTFIAGPEFEVAGQLMGPSVLISALILARSGYGQYLLVHGIRWHGVVGGLLGSVILGVLVLNVAKDMDVFQVMIAVAVGWLARALFICSIGIFEIRRQGMTNEQR